VGLPAQQAAAWLPALGDALQHTDIPQAKADLVHAVCERIFVAGPTIVSARLTSAAYAHGIALARPQVVRARPTGVGRAMSTCSLPIEGRDEWLAAARRLA
jgi:hypothetical protein